ncbi:hypothetical protein B0T18DRAFT_486343 [Schizothecium vesticola]|uniref:Ecp2 effector protein-like domain-containing protein n=1 Tax=Schizothecium vesticola TaxID=314040 RepID=A0AA40F657_9PEZI|nr:hypothetical protein B0T18DRAFT_486343 [Schizothecium vesticola]
MIFFALLAFLLAGFGLANSDCRPYNIFGDGTWRLNDNGEFRQLSQYGSCAFGVRDARFVEHSAFSDASFLRAVIHIGNEDIRGVIHNAIVNSKKCGIPSPWAGWSIYWDPKYPKPEDPAR